MNWRTVSEMGLRLAAFLVQTPHTRVLARAHSDIADTADFEGKAFG